MVFAVGPRIAKHRNGIIMHKMLAIAASLRAQQAHVAPNDCTNFLVEYMHAQWGKSQCEK